jgi:hypothetical protein
MAAPDAVNEPVNSLGCPGLPARGTKSSLMDYPDLPAQFFRDEPWGNAYMYVMDMIAERFIR